MLRTALAAGFLFVTISDAWARSPEPEVLIRVSHSSWVPGPVLVTGQLVASRILLSAGIRVSWEIHRSASAPVDDCAAAAETIDLNFSYSTPAQYKPGALASALPYGRSGVRITVFFDRVALHPTYMPTALVLGHTLAHEIGHVLLRNNAHTERGLMRAMWGPEDYRAMRTEKLRFLPSNATQMRMNLADACAGLAGDLTATNRTR